MYTFPAGGNRPFFHQIREAAKVTERAALYRSLGTDSEVYPAFSKNFGQEIWDAVDDDVWNKVTYEKETPPENLE